MAPGYTNKLAGFPIFGVTSVKGRDAQDEENEKGCLPLTAILVVGGGGAARTGIKNCISVYEIEENSQGLGEAKNIVQHETDSEVCTSIDVSPSGHLVACSMGDSCGVFAYRKFSSDEVKANIEKRLASEAKKKQKKTMVKRHMY
uniref:Uncharacterized protein n=1 Tax=Aplanochytrium stocchinoi TaxID=215587 RepID=A0A7S3PN11_9STRA